MIAADLLLTSRWHLMMMMRRNNEQLLGDKKRGTDLVTRFKFAFAAGRLTSTWWLTSLIHITSLVFFLFLQWMNLIDCEALVELHFQKHVIETIVNPNYSHSLKLQMFVESSCFFLLKKRPCLGVLMCFTWNNLKKEIVRHSVYFWRVPPALVLSWRVSRHQKTF